jgi:hypothetical protein
VLVVQVPFQRWLLDAHPDEVSVMLLQPSAAPEAQPRLTDESIALWAIRVSEYLATLEG